MNHLKSIFSLSETENNCITELTQLICKLNQTGHSPATSGNYSVRLTTNTNYVLISESGLEKEFFTETNLLPVDYRTASLHPDFEFKNKKISDEAALHLKIYQNTKAQCVLHSHLLESIVCAELSMNHFIIFKNLEILKGLNGIKDHNTEIQVNIVNNSQNIQNLAEEIAPLILDSPIILIRGHGFYVWGDSFKQAKRHLEVFEYLFKYTILTNTLRLNA